MMLKTEDEDRRDENNSGEVSLEEKKRQIVEAIAQVSPNFSEERTKQLAAFYSDILASHISWLSERTKT
jgi:hypothetical protein